MSAKPYDDCSHGSATGLFARLETDVFPWLFCSNTRTSLDGGLAWQKLVS